MHKVSVLIITGRFVADIFELEIDGVDSLFRAGKHSRCIT
jgi:hypothetical protein